MILENLCEKLNSFADEKYYKMDFDKVGLFVGEMSNNIKKTVTATDATMEVIDFAIENQADLILCHHPFTFDPMERVTSEDLLQKKVIKLIKNNIAVYSMHTNLDSAPGGLCDIFAEILGLQNTYPILENKVFSEEKQEYIIYPSIGRVGELPFEMTCDQFAEYCRKVFETDYAKSYFHTDRTKKIRKVGVCSGSGKSLLDNVIAMNCDAYLCGDVRHSDFIKAEENNMFLLDLGHYETECTSSVVLEEYLKKSDSSIEVINFEEVRGNRLVKKLKEIRGL